MNGCRLCGMPVAVWEPDDLDVDHEDPNGDGLGPRDQDKLYCKDPQKTCWGNFLVSFNGYPGDWPVTPGLDDFGGTEDGEEEEEEWYEDGAGAATTGDAEEYADEYAICSVSGCLRHADVTWHGDSQDRCAQCYVMQCLDSDTFNAIHEAVNDAGRQ